MDLRRADAADGAALTHIRRSAILALAVPAMTVAQAEAWAAGAAPDRVARAIREHAVWVAVEESPLGWVEVAQQRIAALYVAPSCAGRGIGSALLRCAEVVIQRSGSTMAHLEASPNALAFYLRRGYRRCGPPDADGASPLCKVLAADGLSQLASAQCSAH
jgi:putative acetyltransferase